MALGDFFRINMPYGMEMNSNGEWFCFNREYKPLGWNTFDKVEIQNYPVAVKYKALTNDKLQKLVSEPEMYRINENKDICKVWFYSDNTNPQSYPKYWPEYIAKLKFLSKLKT